MRNIPKIERLERIARAIEKNSEGAIKYAINPLTFLLRHKIKCPYVGDQGWCLVYKYRPLIDRLFGIPIEIWNDENEPRSCNRNTPNPDSLPILDASKLEEEVSMLSRKLEILLTGKIHPAYPIWIFAIFPLENFIEGGAVMKEQKLNPNEQKQKARRKLMKLALYSIPAIATILATEEAYAGGKRTKREHPGSHKSSTSGIS